MSILSIALRQDRRQQPPSSQQPLALHAKLPLWLQVPILAFVSLTVLTISTLTAAAQSRVPFIFELPQAYLPGNPPPQLPMDVDCSMEPAYTVCPVPVLDKLVYVYFEKGTRMISRASIRVYEYRLGDLVTRWGPPTGLNRYQAMTTIYWGNRSAVLYTSALRPDSTIKFITYDFYPPQASPWRGFANSKHGEVGTSDLS